MIGAKRCPQVSGPLFSRAVDIGHIENGQARERWGGLNMYALLTQLGVIPAPELG
jgi:hypothetical protein